MPFVVGLTGGIGSGKSTVASCFQEHGAVVVDADEIARTLTSRGSPVLSVLQQNFGEDILDSEGNLNRSLLAERAFDTEVNTAKLNEIMHPKIRERAEQLIAKVSADRIVVYDMPLLVETNSQDLCDFVVVVDTDVEKQIARLVDSRGLSESDAWNRINRQASRATRINVADLVIPNDGTRADLIDRCGSAWTRIIEQAAQGHPRSLSP